MATKMFKLRICSGGIGFKEDYKSAFSQRGTKFYLSVGLDKNFNLLQGYVIEDGLFVPITPETQLKREKHRRAVYYLFNELEYICTVAIEKSKRGTYFEPTMNVYLPTGQYLEDEIFCSCVNSLLTPDLKKRLAETLLEYAKTRRA